ncbi:MAG: DUF1232 domain-containing protein [Candidatus Sumerlaeota bacterium]
MPKTGTIEYTAQERKSGSHRAKAVVHRSLLQRVGHAFQTFKLMINDRSYVFPTRLKIAAVVLALYVVSPLDIIPDVIPIIGFADDSALVAGVFWMLMSEIGSYTKNRGGNKE